MRWSISASPCRSLKAEQERFMAFVRRSPIAATIVSLVGPQNAPSPDVFGHNRNRPFRHENTGCYFDSGAACDFRGGLHRPASDKRSAGRATGGLNLPLCRCLGLWLANVGDDSDAFRGPISQTDQRSGGDCRVPGRVASFRRGELSSGSITGGQRVALKPKSSSRLAQRVLQGSP
jgi:hypothetical protein